MEQTMLFDEQKRKKKTGYVRSRNNNSEYSPTFTDEEFIRSFDEFCRMRKLNKTETAQRWLMDRLRVEKEDYLNSLSREELIEIIKNGKIG